MISFVLFDKYDFAILIISQDSDVEIMYNSKQDVLFDNVFLGFSISKSTGYKSVLWIILSLQASLNHQLEAHY